MVAGRSIFSRCNGPTLTRGAVRRLLPLGSTREGQHFSAFSKFVQIVSPSMASAFHRLMRKEMRHAGNSPAQIAVVAVLSLKFGDITRRKERALGAGDQLDQGSRPAAALRSISAVTRGCGGTPTTLLPFSGLFQGLRRQGALAGGKSDPGTRERLSCGTSPPRSLTAEIAEAALYGGPWAAFRGLIDTHARRKQPLG